MAPTIDFLKKNPNSFQSQNGVLEEMFFGEKNADPLSLDEVDVAIFTEGTYPYMKGGVSSVIHQIIEEHAHLTFGVVHIAWDRSSKRTFLFPKLPQIKWVYTIYLSDSLNENKKNILSPRKIFGLDKIDDKVIDDLIFGFDGIIKGKNYYFNRIYKDYFNPLTRKVDIHKLLQSPDLINLMIEKFKKLNIPLVDLFWLQRELSTLSLSVLDKIYPKAKVYHSHTSGYAGLAACLASLQHQRKFVLTEHSLYIRDVLSQIDEIYTPHKFKSINYLKGESIKLKRSAWSQWFKSMGDITYHHVHSISYLYDEIAKDALSFGSPKIKQKIIPNGIKFSRFEKARNAQNLRDRLRFLDKNHLWKIGFIGRIVPVKGVLDLIDSIYLLKKIFKGKFVVELIGPTDEDENYFEECLIKVKKLGLEQQMKFLGPQNVAEFLEGVDLCVLSSHSEALPVVILESMSSGVPVVSTEVGSVRQILVDTYSDGNHVCALAAGVICTKKSPDKLAILINDVLTNSELYKKFREEGPKRILQNFQLKDIMNKYSEFFRPTL